MSDLRPVQTDHASVDRRRFLRVAGAGVAGASLLTMLEARQAPAQIKGTTLRILTWSHFIPAYDIWFDKFAKPSGASRTASRCAWTISPTWRSRRGWPPSSPRVPGTT